MSQSMSDGMRPDIAAAWANVSNKMGKKRDVQKLPEYLHGGETVLTMTGGMVAGKNGLLVATDRRALFVSEGLVSHSFEDFPYDRITTVTSSRGMVFGKIVVQTAGAARLVEQIPKGEAEAVAAVIRERVEAIPRERQQPSAASTTSAGAAAPVGVAAELRELAELRDAGVLTPKEFESQKDRLLSR